MPTVVSFKTLTDLFLNLSAKYEVSEKTAFAAKPATDAPYKPIYWNEIKTNAFRLAAWLVEAGVKPDDRVALLSENRIEWVIVDFALQLVGAINVSLYSTLPAEQCTYIMRDAGAEILFVSTGLQLKKEFLHLHPA